jgi:hypothetical protein
MLKAQNNEHAETNEHAVANCLLDGQLGDGQRPPRRKSRQVLRHRRKHGPGDIVERFARAVLQRRDNEADERRDQEQKQANRDRSEQESPRRRFQDRPRLGVAQEPN